MNNIKLWWNIIRPKTLFASVCPVVAGILLNYEANPQYRTKVFISLIILLCAVSLQVLSNLINDYYDYKKGTDKKGRIGFKRALAEGEVTITQMKKAIYIILAIVLLTGLLLIIKGGLPILLIGISAIFFAWLYTASRFSLSYLGIADIFCFLYYGIFAVCGTFYILNVDFFALEHTNWLSLKLISNIPLPIYCVGGICGLISCIVLMINNLRDIESDSIANKKTLPVRFGKKLGEYMILIYSLLMLVFSFIAFGLSFTNIIFIPTFMLFQEISAAQEEKYNKCLFKAGLLNVFFILLLAIEVFI